MADCGCGCGGAGNCNDNLNSLEKNAQVTGNLKWDGASQTCANDSSIDIVTNEGMNSVLQKMWNKICALSKKASYLAHTSLDNILTEVVSVKQTLDLFEFSGENQLEVGEMIRILYTGDLSTVATTGGLDIDARVYGKDSAGVYSTPFNYLIANVGAGQTIVDQFYFTIEVVRVSDTIVHISTKAETRLGSITSFISNNNAAVPDLTTHDLVFDFTVLRSDAGDNFELEYVSMEHVRP
jgi:hypothetical protein